MVIVMIFMNKTMANSIITINAIVTVKIFMIIIGEYQKALNYQHPKKSATVLLQHHQHHCHHHPTNIGSLVLTIRTTNRAQSFSCLIVPIIIVIIIITLVFIPICHNPHLPTLHTP